MTDFRAWGTIMGPAGLTAVFGMGTGGAPPVWSPEMRPGAGRGRRSQARAVVGQLRGGRVVAGATGSTARPGRWGRGGGSGWSSRLAVRTGRLRRSPAVHARPIDLVVFQEPSQPLRLPETLFRSGLRA